MNRAKILLFSSSTTSPKKSSPTSVYNRNKIDHPFPQYDEDMYRPTTTETMGMHNNGDDKNTKKKKNCAVISCPSSPRRGLLSSRTTTTTNKKQQQKQLLRQNRRRRIVRFDRKNPVQVVGTVPPVGDMTREEIRQAYSTPDDMTAVKRSTLWATRDISRKHPEAIELIDELYSHINSLGFDEMDGAIRDPSSYSKSFVNGWCNVEGAGPRGLEKYASAVHRNGRRYRAAEIRTAIVKMSSSASASSFGDNDAEEIADYYSRQCATSKTYARIVGAADAIAVDTDMNIIAAATAYSADVDHRWKQQQQEEEVLAEAAAVTQKMEATNNNRRQLLTKSRSRAQIFARQISQKALEITLSPNDFYF